jgi:hypothetical protein
MTNSFVLKLPGELGEALCRLAIQRGRSPERQLLHWVRIGLHIEGNRSNPDVERIRRLVIDLLENHDRLLADESSGPLGNSQKGGLADILGNRGTYYWDSQDHPGLVQEVRSDESTTLGRFVDGVFVPVDESKGPPDEPA